MYKNSKQTVLFPMLLAAGVALGILLGQYLGRHDRASEIRGMLTQMALPTNKLTYTLSLIENRYVDSVSMDSLAEHVIPMLVAELDPHSVYIPASEMQELNEPSRGVRRHRRGLQHGHRYGHRAQRHSAGAERPGRCQGGRPDRGDRRFAGRRAPGASKRDHETPARARGSKVRLGLERQGIAGLVDVEVERGVIPIRSVESAFRIVDGIGYIRLGQFARTTSTEICGALDTLRAQGISKLIFDLRGNSGGYLDQAILVANEFLHEGQLIVYTEDRHHEQVREYADGTGSAQDMEVAVLIDEASASSSEILAGALQDNDRGTIIGRRSFGKGLVQQQIPYADGSALRLTTARYYTPTGRSIQKPYTIGDEAGYEEDIWNRYRNNEFFTADSIHFADSLKRITPGGKVVYGGGGIMPDVFVPADTTDVTKYFVEVAGRNILYRYTIEYSDRHRDALNAVRTVEDLEALLDSDPGMFDDFVRYAARKGVAPRYGDIARSRKLIEAQLRAYIGRNTPLEDNGFYANIYPVDNVIMRAIAILNSEQDD